jgi:histidine phosphotransferase ChpT
MSMADSRLARLMSARLCHDLGGAVATLAGTLDLLEQGEPEALSLARETAVVLRGRLRLFSAAWGLAETEWPASELAAMLSTSPASPRVGFALDGLDRAGPVAAALVPLVLNGALVGAEALPRGGTVTVTGDARGLVVMPVGRDAAWPPGLVALLAGEGPEALLADGPRRVTAVLLAQLAEAQGWGLSFALGPGEGPPPLLLAPV